MLCVPAGKSADIRNIDFDRRFAEVVEIQIQADRLVSTPAVLGPDPDPDPENLVHLKILGAIDILNKLGRIQNAGLNRPFIVQRMPITCGKDPDVFKILFVRRDFVAIQTKLRDAKFTELDKEVEIV